MKPILKNISQVSYLCSISFYLGMQLVGQTEAAYTAQVTDPTSISAAFVFPNTIKQLEMEADETFSKISDLYDSISTTSLADSDSALANQLTEVMNKEREIVDQVRYLQKIHEEVQTYYEQTKAEPNIYEYVKNGYLEVSRLNDQVNETIDQIKAIQSTIKSKIGETKNLQESETNTQGGKNEDAITTKKEEDDF